VKLAQISEFVFDWKITDPDKNLRVNFVILREYFSDNIGSYFIENWQHECRLFSKPDCDVGKFVTYMNKVDFNRLLVILTHVLDAHFVNMMALILMAS